MTSHDPHDETAAARLRASGAAGWRGSGTVLLADDEVDLRTVGRIFIEKLGFQVIVAADGHEALEVFQRHHAPPAELIALVILDLTMPRMGGVEAMKAIRQIDGGMPVLIASGCDPHEMSPHFTQGGCNGFIQKPFRLSELSGRIRALLDPAHSA
jgi:DNA-binding response OmpR family regulator